MAEDIFRIGQVATGEGNYQPLEPGCYDATFVLATSKMMKKYKSEDMAPKIILTYQIEAEDDDGNKTLHYVRTQPLNPVNNEKSSLTKLLGSWLKKDAEGLVGLKITDFLGQAAQVVVSHEKKDDKTYIRLDNLLPVKKNVKVDVVKDEVPHFLIEGALSYYCAPGITVKPAPEQKAAPAAAPQPDMVGTDDDEDDGKLPF